MPHGMLHIHTNHTYTHTYSLRHRTPHAISFIVSNVWQKLSLPIHSRITQQYRTILLSSSHHTNTIANQREKKEERKTTSSSSTLDEHFLIRNEGDDEKESKTPAVLSSSTHFSPICWRCVCVCVFVNISLNILTNLLWPSIVAEKSNQPRKWFELIKMN